MLFVYQRFNHAECKLHSVCCVNAMLVLWNLFHNVHCFLALAKFVSYSMTYV